MPLSPGIYKIDSTDDYVVGAELGGMFMTSEVLDADDIQELIAGDMELADYDLTDERGRGVAAFTLVPYEKWAEIAGTEVEF